MDPGQNSRILAELEDFVFKKHTNISCNFVSKHFLIHISHARGLMQEFAHKHKGDKNLTIEWMLSECDEADEGQVKLQRYSIVDEEELESTKKQFLHPECNIHAVKWANSTDSSLMFEQFILESSIDNFKKLQSLTYINNPINRRHSRRETVTVPRNTEIQAKATVAMDVKPESKPEPESEPMDIDDTKSLQKKRASSKGDEASKRYKRVRTLDSSEDEDDSKMKENRKVEIDSEFTVTKLAIDPEPEKKPLPKSSQEQVKKRNSNPKLAPKNALKSKACAQPSITSFFKKPAQKN